MTLPCGEREPGASLGLHPRIRGGDQDEMTWDSHPSSCPAGWEGGKWQAWLLPAQAPSKECHVFLFPINIPQQQPSTFLRLGVKEAWGEMRRGGILEG